METMRERMTCGQCKKPHTNDCLNVYRRRDPGTPEDRVCFFCDHATDVGPANGTPTRRDGRRTVTRYEDELEAEVEILEAQADEARECLRDVRLMLNTELRRYLDEPWAKRVMAQEV